MAWKTVSLLLLLAGCCKCPDYFEQQKQFLDEMKQCATPSPRQRCCCPPPAPPRARPRRRATCASSCPSPSRDGPRNQKLSTGTPSCITRCYRQPARRKEPMRKLINRLERH